MDGTLTISRVTGGTESPRIRITVRDESSSVEFVEVSISPEAFGNVVTGLSYQDCKFEVRGIALIGKVHERKTEVIKRPVGGRNSEERAASLDAILASLEVDGWAARRSDADNSHRWVGQGKVSVGFHRYVNPS